MDCYIIFPNLYFILSMYLFFVGLGFELRALCLQSRHSITRTTHPVHFALVD
jgi:hypothetical protein